MHSCIFTMHPPVTDTWCNQHRQPALPAHLNVARDALLAAQVQHVLRLFDAANQAAANAEPAHAKHFSQHECFHLAYIWWAKNRPAGYRVCVHAKLVHCHHC